MSPMSDHLPAAVLGMLQFDSSNYGIVSLVALVVGLGFMVRAYLRGPKGPVRGRAPLLALRLAAIACVLVALLHPIWVSHLEEDEKPVLAVVLDNSLSMSLEVAGDGAKTTRYAKALELLRTQLQPRFAESFDLALFDVRGAMLPPDDLPAAATVPQSPLRAALVGVQRALRTRDVKGIVLLSDGNESRPDAVGSGLESLRLPVYPVDLVRGSAAPTGAAGDIAVQAVIANHRALMGNTVKANVLLAAKGAASGDNIEVAITADQVPVASVVRRWPKGQSDLSVELEFVPRQAGNFDYLVQVRRLGDAAAPELNRANNRAVFPVAVRADALTVLYIDGVLRWEGKFMRAALDADPDIRVVSSVRTAARRVAGPSRGVLAKEQLANADVVVLGDIEPGYFSTGELAALRDWVTDLGGGLLLTGGYLSFAVDGFGATILSQVLPVEFVDEEPTQIDLPFSLKLTEIGRNHSIFHLTGDRVRDSAIWQAMPKLSGCSLIKSIKPGAQVLAVNPELGGHSDVGGLPVMVTQQVGEGRTMVFTIDSTWRWRTIVGGFTEDAAFYRTFWGQLIRFLATEEKEPASRRLLVTTDRFRYPPGEPIKVRLALEAPAGEAAVAAQDYQLRAHAIDESGRRTSISLAAVGNEQYEGVLTTRQTGRLDIVAVAEPLVADRENIHFSRVVAVEIERADLELVNAAPRPHWLARVAQVTGGKFLKVRDLATWELPAATRPKRIITTTGLWHHPALITLFFILLCIEWILRRLRRMA